MTRLMWRSRDARTTTTTNGSQNKIIRHDVFLKRIQKTLYCSSITPHTEPLGISRPFADYAAEVFSDTHKGHSLNRLHYVTVGKMNVSPCSLILALIYLERLQDTDPLYSRKITPTELFLVTMMVSTKFYSGYDGDFIYAKEWAEYGNISTERIQQLELEFLSAVNWNIYVSNQVFFEKLKSIECILAKRQGLKRGWLTYTELANLLPSISIAKAFLQYSALFTVSYAASVVTIAGALFLASQVPGTALYRSSSTTNVASKQSSSTSTDRSNNVMNATTGNDNISQHSNDIRVQNELDNNGTIIDLQLPGCPLDTLDETFERLLNNNETIDENIPMFGTNKPYKSHAINRIFIAIQPEGTKSFGQSIGIQTGVNLRNFLMDGGDGDGDTNLTDDNVDSLTNELQNYWQTLRYDLFYIWVTAF